MDELDAAKQRCVDDVSLYLDREKWFAKLQDKGMEATDAQKHAICLQINNILIISFIGV